MPPPLNEEAASWYRAGSACCLLFAAYSVGGGRLPLPGISENEENQSWKGHPRNFHMEGLAEGCR